MKITKSGEYGLTALVTLASNFESQKMVSLREIAESNKLSIKFLEQVMMALKRAHLVTSVKGKQGGYLLARAPKEITLGEIIRAIDGPLAPMMNAREIRKKIERKDRQSGLYMVMLDVRNAISEILDKKTLEDVLEKSMEAAWSDPSSSMYYI